MAAPAEDPEKIDIEGLFATVDADARAMGVSPPDKMGKFLQSVGTLAIGLTALARQTQLIVGDNARVIDTAVAAARDDLTRQQNILRAHAKKNQSDIVDALGQRIADIASKSFLRNVQIVDRNTTLVLALGFAVCAMALFAAGIWWDRSNAYAQHLETEADRRAAFALSPLNARLWAGILIWNQSNLNESLSHCTANPASNRRPSCFLPLWIGPDQAAPNNDKN